MRLKIENLHFQYGDHVIFNDFNFNCASGARLWLSGQSGSGKSTFLKLVAGLLRAGRGRILWGEEPLSEFSARKMAEFRKRAIGYGDQDLHLVTTWTVTQNLRLVSTDETRIESIMSELGLFDLKNDRVQNLSGGQKQKVLIARLILQPSVVLLLDEPTAHLDDDNTELVMNSLSRHFKNKTSLIVSHDSRVGKWIDAHVSFNEMKR